MKQQPTELELLLQQYELALARKDMDMTEYWAQQIDEYSVREEQFAQHIDQMYDDIWRQ